MKAVRPHGVEVCAAAEFRLPGLLGRKPCRALETIGVCRRRKSAVERDSL